MTKQDVQLIVSETLQAQHKANNYVSWIKTIIVIIIVPVITVFASFKVLEHRVDKQDEELEQKVDIVWYEQYIIGQEKLWNLLKEQGDENEEEINKTNEFLRGLLKDKKISDRGYTDLFTKDTLS